MPMPVKKKRVVSGDSDQEMEDVEEIQNSGDEQAGDGDAGEEEYEIERILDAKSGAFAEGRIGYLVKWKGYSEEHNSWVSEMDAGNATDLIEDFWRRSRKEKKGRKLEGKLPPPKGQKSISARAQSSDAEPAPQKKRGRPSKVVALSISDDEEEEEVPKTKKPKQVAKRLVVPTPARKPKAREVEPDEEMEDEEVFSDIKKLKNADDWSPFVDRIDTIERTTDGTLFVYFLLNTKGKGKVGDSTHRCRERSDICRQKMPQRLLDFYEENLRWRKIDGEDE